MDNLNLELSLLNQIDKKKKKMVEVASDTGMNSYQTLKCSQELDVLINLHMKHFSPKGRNMFNSAS
ncbi:aspartyl-phosphate phosphatase Spo0E family protein [Robertmurraya korlensis]|uniref:aspartyl-phosphate phosphatase Spo0E family protein n=1 Tax=Robertmurraya korlensis TaxID=519977 RepID=UPI000825E798|nr:aspartyl-phosphate phosphatase Spo0E family protein [Robertmurraya korlensis]